MRKGATTSAVAETRLTSIVALRNEKGSYNENVGLLVDSYIVALRNEKGSYNR